jgi:TetR/AcrR family transcriptional regulator, transcriptional repressor for nem operon
MRKGEATRQRIAAKAAEVFNLHGVAGSSLADVMAASGHRKGGIYNHFASKEELALAAFDHAAAAATACLAPAWEADGLARLRAFVAAFRAYGERPPLPGGCPVLNTAIECDDGDPALRDRVRAVVDDWRGRLRQGVAVGQARGEIRPEIDGEDLASVTIATLEGGVMLSRLYGDAVHLRRAADHLADHLDRAVAA